MKYCNQTQSGYSYKFIGYEEARNKDWVAFRKIKEIQPFIRDMEKTKQDPVWHGEGDVWTHTKMVIQEVFNHSEFLDLEEHLKHILVAAAFFHDIEKPRCTIEVPASESSLGRDSIQSPMHAKNGESSARDKSFKLSGDLASSMLIGKLVRWHGVPTRFGNEDNPYWKAIWLSHELPINLLCILTESDIKGRISSKDSIDWVLMQVDYLRESAKDNDCYYSAYTFLEVNVKHRYLNKTLTYPALNLPDTFCSEAFLMIGLSGSGKSTFIKEYLKKQYPSIVVISQDKIRSGEQFAKKKWTKQSEGRVKQEVKRLIKICLANRHPFVLDATLLTADDRKRWTDIIREYNGKIIYNIVQVNPLIQNKRNKLREGVEAIPTIALNKQRSRFETPTADEAHIINWWSND